MKAEMFNYSGWISDTDPKNLDDYFRKILVDAGFNILSFVDHHFNPFGYTSLYLLSESHFAIHTFPEEGKTYFELSSCIEVPYLRFKECLKE